MGDLPNRAVAPRIDAQRMAGASRGVADLTLQPLSELIHAPGVEVVGPVPNEVQFVSVFSAAVVAGSEQVEAAQLLIAFLASTPADAALTNNGMERLRQ